MSFDIRPVTQENYEETIQLLDVAFASAEDEYFRRHQLDDPDYSFEQGRVAVADGKIVSHVVVFHRTMSYGRGKIAFGAIGDVGTHPDHRREGFANALLNDSVAYMKRRRMPLSMLYTGTHALYEKSGWVTVPATELAAKAPDSPREGPRGYMVKPFEGPELKDLEDHYRHAMSNLVGPTVRSHAYFENMLGWIEVNGKVRWDVIYKVGHAVGYVRTRARGETLTILDVAASNEPLAQVACSVVVKHAVEAGCSAIGGRISPEMLFVKELGRYANFDLKPGMHQMMRLNDLRGAMEAAQPEFHRRLRVNPLAGSPVVLRAGGQEVRVEFPVGTVRIGDPVGDEQILELNDVEFLSLLMGNKGSHGAIRNSDLSNVAKAMLQAIFPENGHVCWMADTY